MIPKPRVLFILDKLLPPLTCPCFHTTLLALPLASTLPLFIPFCVLTFFNILVFSRFPHSSLFSCSSPRSLILPTHRPGVLVPSPSSLSHSTLLLSTTSVPRIYIASRETSIVTLSIVYLVSFFYRAVKRPCCWQTLVTL